MIDFNSRVAHVFREALDIEPTERGSYLDQTCTDDPVLRAAIDDLLARMPLNTDETDPPLPAARLFESAREAVVRSRIDRHGERIGAFRVVAPLGAGGMGEVWLAERVDGGFAQQVAIKWLGVTLRADAHARFEQERAILARLDHPGIARILDGGSVDGTPWFAMEYIAGEPLDVYFERVQPPLVAVIRLLIKVCEALQFAHQNLVVHRDIKPSNILVDHDGQPRLVDFGVAKTLDSAPALTHKTHAPMTYAYAAPEQMTNQPITTAADVYALGVVFYELLAGVRPHQGHAGNVLELVAAVTDSEPQPPSSTITASRSTRWRSAALRGDLDTIALKALARDPARRYSSAQGFGEDLARHLDGLPIQARPDSVGYRLRKLLRRHPLASALGAAALASLVALTAISLSQARRADAEAALSALAADSARIQARQADAVVVHLATVFNRAQSAGETIDTKTLIEWAGDSHLAGVYGDPAMNRALKLAISEFMLVRNDFPRALEVLDALAPELKAASPREQLQAQSNRTRALFRLGRLDEAQLSLASALALLPPVPVEKTAILQIYAGELHRSQGRPKEAALAALEAVKIADQLTDVGALVIGEINASAANGLLQVGYLDDAARLGERAVDIWQRGQVSANQSLPSVRALAPNALYLRGNMLKAIELFTKIDADPAFQGESVPARAARATGFAKALAFANRGDEAILLIESARMTMCKATGEASMDCTRMLLAAAETAQFSQDYVRAERHLSELEAILAINPVPVLQTEISLLRLRAAAVTQPTTRSVAALIEAVATPDLAGMGLRKAVRSLLISAQQLRDREQSPQALELAKAALQLGKNLPTESGGMDRALLEIWRARIDSTAVDPAAIDSLRAAIGPDHPWVRSA